MFNVVDRVILIRKCRFWLEDRLRDMVICPDCLDEVVEQMHELEARERDHDELVEVEADLPNTRVRPEEWEPASPTHTKAHSDA